MFKKAECRMKICEWKSSVNMQENLLKCLGTLGRILVLGLLLYLVIC